MAAKDLIDKYLSFFQARGHKIIPGAPLVPENDPTTLFTSSGMQPLVAYLLGETHPEGKRLVNIQNCFRAQDLDEVGDNRHTTFFRMLGNWSLGDYFKKEQLPWFFEFLTDNLKIDAKKLYISIFEGFDKIPKDEESANIWKELFRKKSIDPQERIFYYGPEKNWWSRSGVPKNMPEGEPGGPDSEVFFDFETKHDVKFGEKCHINCDCGRFLEIGNSVFMEYKKGKEGFEKLPQQNVDFGGGLERILAVIERKSDIFETSLFYPIIEMIVRLTNKNYINHAKEIRIVTDHFISAVFIASSGVYPSNKEQGYILRRLIRRGLDNFYKLEGKNIEQVIHVIVEQYKDTDTYLVDNFEKVKNIILEEEQAYNRTLKNAREFIAKKYGTKKAGGELLGMTEISADDAFLLYSTHGLSPAQIKSLGYAFDEQEFARKMEEHQKLSRQGSGQRFKGGLADTEEKTVMGHTATHLLHKALRDVLGEKVHQTGSNITTERVRFDFFYEKKLTSEEIQKVEEVVNQKIKENLPVHFEILDIEEARKKGAIGLFNEKYGNKVKVYFIGGGLSTSSGRPYSAEFCGGPHVNFTGEIKSFKIIKEEGLGKNIRRIYAIVGE
ncbi:MAG: hypothetical protein A2857_02640 [Candidatus Levybacteria bacterium RIFCSPHIGHO2_01_FULL_36_15]|nr:MAG: hypothetical protein A2857_02640 [Candidatus Levybacteria bacterium RIFCSPHIGHO2_01_FULL_36_15]OGH38601.1 MAG: hypothetical protein A2905_03160 [Candidatus Levybacteria bacterium RIFCSPLOWO2_01_FULL_36_10]